jgi:DNA-binding transcriptional ArsR family regulator
MHIINLKLLNRNLFTLCDWPLIMETDLHPDLQSEVAAIKSKLGDMHKDMLRFMERSNQQHLTSILNNCRSNFSGALLGYAGEEIETGLESRMVRDCQMKETCKALFSDLLKNNLGRIREGEVSEEAVSSARAKMEQMRAKAPYEQCRNCFSEATRLFDKQIDLMRSLRVYRDHDVSKDALKDLPEERVVSEILGPLSNKQRLQMLKALSIETMTFSALSGLTGLRGGNLLFHLQKLQESRMIMQRNERGDYMITEKGFAAFLAIADLYAGLGGKSTGAKAGEDIADDEQLQLVSAI